MHEKIVFEKQTYVLQEKNLNSRNEVFYFLNSEVQKGIYLKRNTEFAEYEKQVLERLSDANIPVPTLVKTLENIDSVATMEVQGETLYRMAGLPKNKRLDIIYKMGKWLAVIHNQNMDSERSSNCIWDDLRIMGTKVEEVVLEWLKEKNNFVKDMVFVHGDYQLGNILISKGDVSGIIDWEFSGQGVKEKDIAWAITVRQNCDIYFEEDEVSTFINGYLSVGTINQDALKWYRVKCLLFFYNMVFEEDMKYASILLEKIGTLIKMDCI